MPARTPESAIPPTVQSTPTPTLVQNAVDLSSSLSCGRCTIAAPSATSENTITRLASTRAIAARPYSSGDEESRENHRDDEA